MRPPAIVGYWGVLLAFLLPASAGANIGPKWWGDRAAEPLGLKGVAITSEKLSIDLRPLTDVRPVEVKAIYQLNNAGAVKKIELFFLTGVAGIRDFTVRLDDRLLASRQLSAKEWPVAEAELPASWRPPEDMPGIDSNKTRSHIHRRPSEQIVLAFTVELPPGRSILRAHYSAKAYGEDEDYPTVTWQFPYILAPAREWGSFGGLDVTIYLPENWQGSSTPCLEREGDVLCGRFAGLPADCLALAVRQPMGPELQRQMQQTIRRCAIRFALVLIGGGILCWWTGRLLGWFLVKKTLYRSPLWSLPSALLMPIVWSAAILFFGHRGREAILGVLGGQESPYFHERLWPFALVSLGLLPVVLLVGFLLVLNSFERSIRSTTER